MDRKPPLRISGAMERDWHRSDRPTQVYLELLNTPPGVPVYRLMVSRRGKTDPTKMIFQTQDVALVDRIEAAINEVAKKRGAALQNQERCNSVAWTRLGLHSLSTLMGSGSCACLF